MSDDIVITKKTLYKRLAHLFVVLSALFFGAYIWTEPPVSTKLAMTGVLFGVVAIIYGALGENA